MGSRVVASVEPTVNGKNVVKHGLVYALTKLGDKDTGVKNIDMTVSADNYYVASLNQLTMEMLIKYLEAQRQLSIM